MAVVILYITHIHCPSPCSLCRLLFTQQSPLHVHLLQEVLFCSAAGVCLHGFLLHAYSCIVIELLLFVLYLPHWLTAFRGTRTRAVLPAPGTTRGTKEASAAETSNLLGTGQGSDGLGKRRSRSSWRGSGDWSGSQNTQGPQGWGWGLGS